MGSTRDKWSNSSLADSASTSAPTPAPSSGKTLSTRDKWSNSSLAASAAAPAAAPAPPPVDPYRDSAFAKFTAQSKDGNVDVGAMSSGEYRALANQLYTVRGNPDATDDTKGLFNYAIDNYGDQLREHMESLQKGFQDENYDESYNDKPWWSKPLGAVGAVGRWLDSGWQGAGAALTVAGNQADGTQRSNNPFSKDMWSGVGQGVKEFGRGAANLATFSQIDALDVPDSILAQGDLDGDGRISFMEGTFEREHAEFGRWYGSGVLEWTANMAGEIVLDPLNVIGGAGMAKQGLGVIRRQAAKESMEAGGDALVRQVGDIIIKMEAKSKAGRTGLSNLSEAEAVLIRRLAVDGYASSMLSKAPGVLSKKDAATLSKNARKAADGSYRAKERVLKLEKKQAKLADEAAALADETTEAGAKLAARASRKGFNAADDAFRGARPGVHVKGRTVLGVADGTIPKMVNQVPVLKSIVPHLSPRWKTGKLLSRSERAGVHSAAQMPAGRAARLVKEWTARLVDSPAKNSLDEMVGPDVVSDAIRRSISEKPAKIRPATYKTREGVEKSRPKIKGTDKIKDVDYSKSIRELLEESDEFAVKYSAMSPEGKAGIDSAINEVTQSMGDVLAYVNSIIPESVRLSSKLPDNYGPRILNPDFQSMVDDLLERGVLLEGDKTVQGAFESLAGTGGKLGKLTASRAGDATDPNLFRRTFMPKEQNVVKVNDASEDLIRNAVAKFNETATTKIDIEDVPRMFEENPMTAWAVRSRNATTANIQNDFVVGLAKVADRQGDFIFGVGKKPQNTGDTKYVQLDDDYFGRKTWAAEDIVPEIDSFRAILEDPNSLQKFVRSTNDAWARWATFSPGFVTRNFAGNKMFMYMGGMRSAAPLIKAVKYNKAYKESLAYVHANGVSMEAAAKAVAPDDPNFFAWMSGAIDHGITKGYVEDAFSRNGKAAVNVSDPALIRDANGFLPAFGRELKADGSKYRPNLLRGSATTANPTRISKWAGSKLEETDRLALFIDQMQKGNTIQGAAEHTRKYMLDYGDLTDAEQAFKGSVSRFYTFMRKNTSLQVEYMLASPGKANTLQKIQSDAGEQMASWFTNEGEDGALGWAPPWVQAAGMSALVGGGFAGLDSPLAAATRTAESVAGLAALPLTVAGLEDDVIPEGLRNALFYGDTSDKWKRAASLFSGILPASMELVSEGQTGVEAFTGRSVDKSLQSEGTRILGNLNPGVDRVWRLLEDFGQLDKVPGLLKNEGFIEETRAFAQEKYDKSMADEVERAQANDRDPDFSAAEAMGDGEAAVEELLTRGSVGDLSSMALNWMMGVNYYAPEKAERNGYWTLRNDLQAIMDAPGSPSMTELIAAGELQAKQVVAQTMTYSSGASRIEELIAFIGKDEARALGLTIPEFAADNLDSLEAIAAEDLVHQKVDAYEGILALHGQDRPINAEEFAKIALGSAFQSSNVDIESAGYEPGREANFWDTEDGIMDSPSGGMTVEDTLARMEVIAGWRGFTMEELYGKRLTDIERAIADGKTAVNPRTKDEVVGWWGENNLNRIETENFHGIDAVNMERDGTYTERQQQQDQTAYWQLSSEYTLMYQLKYGKTPTPDQISQYIFAVKATKGDQELVYGEGDSRVRNTVPNAVDIQSVAGQREDARKEFSLTNRKNPLPFVGNPALAPDPRKINRFAK